MAERVGVLFVQSQEGFGADSAVHAQLMRYLDRSKFDVHVACARGANGEALSLRLLRQIPDLSVRPTQFAPSLRRRSVRAVLGSLRSASLFPLDFAELVRYARRAKIRVVHSTERPRDASYNLALCRLIGARSVVHVHVKWSNAYSKLARWGVRSADAAFAISNYVAGTIVGEGKPPSEVYTVLNGIDVAGWDPALDGRAIRRELAIPDDALVMVSVSRLLTWKGQRELVRAFAVAHARVPNSRLLIVGDDNTEVEAHSFTDELRELARGLGVADKVIFTGLRSDIPQLLAASDIFSMPSFEEPFGLVFLEAMAMRRPVIAVDNGGTPEVVEHGKSGLLSPAWDVPKLAENLLRLLEDAELRKSMGAYGREQVLARFTSQRMAHDAGLAYEKLLRA